MNCPTCKMHIDEHPASRCLDYWIATDAMEWKIEDGYIVDSDGRGVKLSDEYPYFPSRYSTSIAPAWKVLEKLERDGWEWHLEKGSCILWRPEWVTNSLSAARPCIEGKADDTKQAICRAAIKAMQG